MLAFFAGLRVAVLHTHDTGEAFLVDVLEDVAVVDLAGRRLVSPRVVADLEVGDLVPGGIDVGNEVALGDLLVLEIVQNLAGRAIDRLTDLVGMRNLFQEKTGMIVRVQRFEHHHQAVRLQDFGRPFQTLDNMGRLVAPIRA